jgi:hypothetical protein
MRRTAGRARANEQVTTVRSHAGIAKVPTVL